MDILNAIRLAENITVNENEIRQYILMHPSRVLNMSITELAKNSFSSPATVTRFCRKVGSAGFAQLKIELAQELSRSENSDSEVEQVSKVVEELDPTDSIINRVTRSAIRAIHSTHVLAEKETYEKVAHILGEATAIDFFGNGTSNLCAQDAAFKFMRIGKTVSFFELIDRQRIQAMITPTDHVAVIYSYSGEGDQILLIAKSLKKRNITVVAVTTKDSSLAKYADYVLPVSKTEPVMRKVSMSSRITQMYVTDIIFNMCFALKYDEYITKTEDTIVL